MRFQEQMNKNNAVKNIDKKINDWGSLTMAKPTVFARKLIKDGVDITLIKEYLMKHYFVSETNANLVYQTIKNQKTIIKNDNLINLLVSFKNFDVSKNETSLQILKKELEKTKQLIFKKAYVVRSICVDGDMLNVLNSQEINNFLSEISYPISEFTVEIDNLNNINEEKLLILKNHGVTRLVLKPKTFVVKTLKTFFNKPTNAQLFNAYMLALKHNFIVELQLMAGLKNETLTNFKKSISTVVELSPHNITITSLSSNQTAESMIYFAIKTLSKAGYKPYFFCKENTDDQINKIGFAQEKNTSLYNIDIAEETLTLLTCEIKHKI